MSTKGIGFRAIKKEEKTKAVEMIVTMASSGEYTKNEIVTAVSNKFRRSRSWVTQLGILKNYDLPTC